MSNGWHMRAKGEINRIEEREVKKHKPKDKINFIYAFIHRYGRTISVVGTLRANNATSIRIEVINQNSFSFSPFADPSCVGKLTM